MLNTVDFHISKSDYMQVDLTTNSGTEAECLATTVHEAFTEDHVTRQFNKEMCLKTNSKGSKLILPGMLLQ